MHKGRALRASHPRDEERGDQKQATNDEPAQRGERAEAEATTGANAQANRQRTSNSKPRDSVASGVHT